MSMNMCSIIVSSLQTKPSSFLVSQFNHPCQIYSSTLYVSSFRKASQSEGSERRVTEEDHPIYSGASSSSRTQLDLLEQLSSGYESDGNSRGLTIRDQLAKLAGDRDDEFSIPLGKNLKKVSPKFLTVSQKRNIKRRAYLNEVSKRNDSLLFASIGAFVIVPPLVILGIAIATGYVQLDSLLYVGVTHFGANLQAQDMHQEGDCSWLLVREFIRVVVYIYKDFPTLTGLEKRVG